ncbi:MAG: hypothetical protein ACPL4E_04300 [Thermoproteota archaeon]
MTNPHRWRRIGSLIFSIGIGILVAALLRGMAMAESCGTSPKEGSAEAMLGPLLLEPRKTSFAISRVQPEVPVDIEVLRLPDKTVLFRFNNIRAKELYDIPLVDRGLYVFSLKASGDGNIQSVDLVFTVGGPPRDMVLLSILLGLAGIIIFLIPTLVEKAR